MHTEFRRALIPNEIPQLLAFDQKVFAKADWFSREEWKIYESWWMLVGRRKVGCCAFLHNADFREDISTVHAPLRGSLYISTTGILTGFQKMGFGAMLKSWQISYARFHRFDRIVTNTRKSNAAMIGLNRRFNFKILRTTPDYYRDPREPTVVMELRLG